MKLSDEGLPGSFRNAALAGGGVCVDPAAHMHCTTTPRCMWVFTYSVAFGTSYWSAVPAGRSGPSLRPSRTAALTSSRSRRSSGGRAITASWIAVDIVSGLSSGFSAHCHHDSNASLLSFIGEFLVDERISWHRPDQSGCGPTARKRGASAPVFPLLSG